MDATSLNHHADRLVHAVVVTFHPSKDLLIPLLSKLSAQCNRVHVIDNTPTSSRENYWGAKVALPNVEVHALGNNLGIATALNAGVRQALEQGATHVLLSDQDSQPEEGMVLALVHAMNLVEKDGTMVAAIGPTFTDRNTGITFPFQAKIPGKFFYGHVHPTSNVPTVEAITLITSGMLIPAAALQDVGLMREDFFIDHVDIEWCHRARARGWRVFGTSEAIMQHSMGDDTALQVWYFGWRRESSYPPIRTYYRIRNFIALLKLDYIPLRWKLRNACYWTFFVYSQAFFGPCKRMSVRMALRGLWDGARNHMHQYEKS